MLLIYTPGALLVAAISLLLSVGAFMLVPGVGARDLPFALGASLILASVPVELMGMRSRLFFIPTWAWGLAAAGYGIITQPTIGALVTALVVAVASATLYVLRAKLRFDSAADGARANLTLAASTDDPFEAVALACEAVFTVTKPDPAQCAHNRQAIARVFSMTGGKLADEYARPLRALDAEYERVAVAGGAVNTDVLYEGKLALERVAELGRSGVLDVTLPATTAG